MIHLPLTWHLALPYIDFIACMFTFFLRKIIYPCNRVLIHVYLLTPEIYSKSCTINVVYDINKRVDSLLLWINYVSRKFQLPAVMYLLLNYLKICILTTF